MQLVLIPTCYSFGSGCLSQTGNVPLVPLQKWFLLPLRHQTFFFLCMSWGFLTPLQGHFVKQVNFMFWVSFSA